MSLDPALLSILVCPDDRGPLLYVEESLYNPRLRRRYRIDDGIPVLLIDEALEVDDDEHQRLLAAGAS
ncbi:MAG: Trm112 family protein [Actinomycetota bacterium]|nr:Trm112 family protein [Actinomycetota bacterium]